MTSPALFDAPRQTFVRVTGGRFYCENCGASWVGTWHGPVEQMTCRWCDAPMNVTKPWEMPDPDSVLGCCQHGVDLDRDFCPEGCRV